LQEIVVIQPYPKSQITTVMFKNTTVMFDETSVNNLSLEEDKTGDTCCICFVPFNDDNNKTPIVLCQGISYDNNWWSHSVCNDCYDNIDVCPICRAPMCKTPITKP